MPGISGPPRRSIVRRITLLVGFIVGPIFLTPAGRGDEFGRLVGPPLFDLVQRADAHGQTKLSIRAIEALPEVLRGERSAFVIVITDQGNMAKLLLSSGMRKRQGEGGKSDLVPVITMDRFETIDAGDRMSFKARGRDVILFVGFAFDLDSGQVVPEGFGGDIRLDRGRAQWSRPPGPRDEQTLHLRQTAARRGIRTGPAIQRQGRAPDRFQWPL